MPRLHFALLALMLAMPAHAAIYKYVDADGNVTFTDKYKPGATKLADGPDGPVTIRMPTRHGKTSIKGSPANFPRVDSGTQRKRDDLRRMLLLEERGKEEKSLAQAQASLNAGTDKSPSEREKLDAKVRLHQKNIELLDMELARVK